RIEQQMTYIDPYFAYIMSPTHLWRTAYRTSEFDPEKVRKLLSTHPDLAEPDGKPDASKRVALAKFMLDVGWLQLAKEDIEKLRKDFPNGVPMGAKEAFDALVKEVDVATAALVIREAELALGGGPAAAVWPVRSLPTPLSNLVAAAETVYAELHPDSAGRIEAFVNLAATAERLKGQDRDPTRKPDELLAAAVSGWAKGKNGATEKPELALRIWAARETVLGYQRAGDLNSRNTILAQYRRGKLLPIDEPAPNVAVPPPARPAELLRRPGTPTPPHKRPPAGR